MVACKQNSYAQMLAEEGLFVFELIWQKRCYISKHFKIVPDSHDKGSPSTLDGNDRDDFYWRIALVYR